MSAPTSVAPPVEASGLVRAYDGETVLSLDSPLRFGPGSVHVLVGPNGAGKTTFLRLIAGLERPDAGELRVLGHDWSRPAREALEIRRRIGLVAQRPYLFWTSALRNVEYPLRARGLARPERERRARGWMERLGVGHLAERRARTLSAGEAQRVSLARALVSEPELVLLDEPQAFVDPEWAPVLEGLCRELASRGATVIVATHLVDMAYRLSAEVVRIERGRLSPPAVENVLEGELAGGDGGEAVLVTSGGLRLSVAPPRPPRRDESRVRAAIAPSDIVVSAEGLRSSARNSLSGRVTGLEERGGVVRLTAEVGAPAGAGAADSSPARGAPTGLRLVAAVTQRSIDELGITVGSAVVLTFKATAVKVF